MKKTVRSCIYVMAGLIAGNFLSQLFIGCNWNVAMARSFAQLAAVAIFIVALHTDKTLLQVNGETFFSGTFLLRQMAFTLSVICLVNLYMLYTLIDSNVVADTILFELISLIAMQLLAIGLCSSILFARTRRQRQVLARTS